MTRHILLDKYPSRRRTSFALPSFASSMPANRSSVCQRCPTMPSPAASPPFSSAIQEPRDHPRRPLTPNCPSSRPGLINFGGTPGYKQLAEVERAWRSLKTHLGLRPTNHRKADRIEAHVLLCWLALLLIRACEIRCGLIWPRIRQELNRLHKVELDCTSGRFVQRTELTNLQRQLFTTMDVALPPRFESITPSSQGDTETVW